MNKNYDNHEKSIILVITSAIILLILILVISLFAADKLLNSYAAIIETAGANAQTAVPASDITPVDSKSSDKKPSEAPASSSRATEESSQEEPSSEEPSSKEPSSESPSSPGEEAKLSVDCILQKPELPNGCEVTSLAMAMNYKGYKIDKCDLADEYLPTWEEDEEGDPEEYYLGDPREDGLYCFQGALITAIDDYNDSMDETVKYKDLSGKSPEDLYEQIKDGNPVIVWCTVDWKDPDYDGKYYQNSHCVVLSGYTENEVITEDPLEGHKNVDKSTFEKIWKAMDKRALTITK